MARSPYQSDFVVHRDEPPEPILAPPSARAVKWVYIATAIVIAAFVFLCLVGPHIPAGE